MIYEPLPGESLPEVNIQKIEEVVTKQCLRNLKHVVAASKDLSLDLDIREQSKNFLQTYFIQQGDNPVLNLDAIQKLSEFLVQNMMVLSDSEMIKTAEKSLEDLKDGETAYFYSHTGEPLYYADPMSSGDYMMRLVEKFAKERKIKIVYVKENSIVDGTIRIIEDLSYSGVQVRSRLKVMNENNRIKVFLAGCTDFAANQIMELDQFIDLELVALSQIPSLGDVIGDQKDILSYFQAQSIGDIYSRPLEFPDNVSWRIKNLTNHVLEGVTLCRTTYRIPDSLSMVSELRNGFEDIPNKLPYPRLEENSN